MLFKSLRERILVFFSLLIIVLQLVSFSVLNSTARDSEARRVDAQRAAQERVVADIIESRYVLLESSLLSIAATWQNQPLLQTSTANPAASFTANNLPGLSWNKPNAVYLAHGNTQQSALLWPAEANQAESNILTTISELGAAATSEHPVRDAFVYANQYYLAVSLPAALGEDANPATLTLVASLNDLVSSAVLNTLGLELRANIGSAAPSGAVLLQKEKLPQALLGDVPLLLLGNSSASVSDVDRQKSVLMLLMAAALLLTLLGGYALADELTRPLKDLTRAAAQIKSGDYNLPAKQYRQDEIGQLASTLSHMCETIAEREQKIIGLAYADSLTCLPNRALFDDRLNNAVSQGIRHGGNFSIAIMDLDRFKYINDVLGHEAGDYVLCEVARRLESVLRESDTVARLGGDEFAILLSGGSEYQVQAAVNKILDIFDEPVNLNGQPLDVACSIGIAHFPQHGEDASLLLRRADMAMYAAKRFNAGFSYYTPECDQHQEQHLSLLGDIKRAVEEDELQLHYQPKISLDNNEHIAVETLLRWQHPHRGLIPPQEFIPFAEHTGAIKLITRWLLVHAMRQCGRWHSQGLNIQMSLNISARDLIDPEFPTHVSNALEENNVKPELICLEITESALMQDPAKARRTIDVLSTMGIKMSIDDYGTGYSSLAYVKNLSVNELKIDREFVSNMMHNAEDSAIVKSTIELGHNLGMRVVAEGIEHENEMELLKDFGCDQGQGFLISHALTANELEAWYRNRAESEQPVDGEVSNTSEDQARIDKSA
ncbi:MAG: EAL domain-containing protein [Gammaproteobacteria bacterium]|nr:EAL domain-containing protein [Gammaproteobacteria bacterium]NNM11169.1 EAL domain-containing protein [Pseudomonadales bacterium]RZV57741.1 MAG: EAL domain-containing protein [Pseudomonadales bacterium]